MADNLYYAEDSIEGPVIALIVPHIPNDKIKLLAASLGFSDTEIRNTIRATEDLTEQNRAIINRWIEKIASKGSNTVGYLTEQLQEWQENGFVSYTVWDALRKKVHMNGTNAQSKTKTMVTTKVTPQTTTPSAVKELTDPVLHSISKEFTSTEIIRELGIALGLERSDINAILTDHSSSVRTASYEILQRWFDTQDTSANAYIHLKEALINIKQNKIATKYLP